MQHTQSVSHGAKNLHINLLWSECRAIYVGQIERGTKTATITTLRKIAKTQIVTVATVENEYLCPTKGTGVFKD